MHTPNPYGTGSDPRQGRELADALGLEPLPEEGGLFRRTHFDGYSSAIYFMLVAPDVSALHRLRSAEVYHWYGGAPLHLLLLHPDGSAEEPVLGPDVARGQQPQLVVPPGVWQGSSTTDAWSLCGTTMAPPFGWGGFELGTQEPLTARHPQKAQRIAELTP